jgi:hypothetical protein
MTNHPDRADNGSEAPAEAPPRKAPRGHDPLSTAHRRRLLKALDRAAAAGDVSAQQALVELSSSAQRDKAIAGALARLEADIEGEG